MIIKNIYELTPIEEHLGVYFKRDDLFMPYDNMPVSGGKVRQMISLVEDNLKAIKNQYNNTIISGVSVDSPQAVITSTVAKHYRINCTLVYGNTTRDNLERKIMCANALKGCTRLEIAKASYQNVLDSYVDNLIKLEPAFKIKFGLNLENNQNAIIDSVANQVKNIPDFIDTIVVPAGSAIMYSGIVKGVLKYQKKANVIGVQISGIDMSKTVNRILRGLDCENNNRFKLIIDNTYKYHKRLKIKITEDFILDPIYEAKAYEYMQTKMNLNGNILFWVVGNSIPVREKIYDY